MKRTINESEIRQIIREALCELGGGVLNAIDDSIRKFGAELVRLYCKVDESGKPTTLCVKFPREQFTGSLDEFMSEEYGLNRYAVRGGTSAYKVIWYRNDVQRPINERVEEWDQQLRILNTELRKYDAQIDEVLTNYNPKYGIKRPVVIYRRPMSSSEQESVERAIIGLLQRDGYELDPRRGMLQARPGFSRLQFRIKETDRRSWRMQAKNVAGGYGGYGSGVAESVDQIVSESINYVLNEMDVYAQQDQYEISLFLQGLQQGRGEAMEDSVWVRYPEEETNENDPRYICYDFDNPGYLRDDHYSRQHIPLGTSKREVRNAIENNLGIRLPDDPADYEEEY